MSYPGYFLVSLKGVPWFGLFFLFVWVLFVCLLFYRPYFWRLLYLAAVSVIQSERVFLQQSRREGVSSSYMQS